VHPSAVIDASAALADGVQVLAFGYVGAGASVGFGTLLNTAAVVSHDCAIGAQVNLSPGSLLAGEVVVGDGSLVGMGATVNIGVRVGAGVRIGNSAVVKADVPDGTVVRAGAVWPPRD
jgi:acyl-[acyl carrier protein]--UDP-N-acetylglucosamine O-acyltransferase